MKKATKCLMSKQAMIFDLDQGLSAEYQALDLCQFLFKVLPDPVDRGVIAKIIKDEQKHIKIVGDLKKELIDYYQV